MNKKQTAFRFSEDLLRRLRVAAKREHLSLNNYVESVLMDIVREPNQETLEAIREAMEDENLTVLDMSSFDDFVASLSDC